MNGHFLNLKLDVVFKKFFVDNPNLLKRFIADVLKLDVNIIDDITILNPELVPDEIDGKFGRLDLAVSVDGKLIDIEMQVNSEDYYKERSLYYWSKLFTSNIKKGDTYDVLKPVISINVIDFNIFEGDDYHTEVSAYHNNGIDSGLVEFSDKLKLHFLELKKVGHIGGHIGINDNTKWWMNLINATTKEELGMLNEKLNDKVYGEAVDAVYRLSEDKDLVKLAEAREYILLEEKSKIKSAERRGKEAAKEKARSEMKKQGISDDIIEKIISAM